MCSLPLPSLTGLPEGSLTQYKSSVTSVVKPSLTHCHPHIRDISLWGSYLFHYYRVSAFSLLCCQHLVQYLVFSEYRVRDSPYNFYSFLFLYTAKRGGEGTHIT